MSRRIASALIALALLGSLGESLNADEGNPSATPNSITGTREYTVGPALQQVPVEKIEQAYEGRTPPEAIRMYLAIVKGSRMGAGEGWFGPGQSRYDWNWLAKQHGIEPDGTISAEQFSGSPAWFARFDRNRDRKISGDELDWSERSQWVQQTYLINRLFRKVDPNGDGKLTRDEWQAFFDGAAEGKTELTTEDLRNAWLSGLSSGFLPGDAPTKEILLKGLFAGEVGSLKEGPQINEPAPDFKLTTHDGKQTIQLSEKIGTKPIVIVFGNFTCGPFRSMYPGVEEIHSRFKNDAEFLAVYVREAHPTDGWKMESNTKVGVAVSQPKDLTERMAIAGQCQQLLKSTIPLLVDTIDDATGNAYSGMPARLYVIDAAGRVAYKSGRGPFGFKSGEMEQALVMTLLDQQKSKPNLKNNTAAKPGASARAVSSKD